MAKRKDVMSWRSRKRSFIYGKRMERLNWRWKGSSQIFQNNLSKPVFHSCVVHLYIYVLQVVNIQWSVLHTWRVAVRSCSTGVLPPFTYSCTTYYYRYYGQRFKHIPCSIILFSFLIIPHTPSPPYLISHFFRKKVASTSSKSERIYCLTTKWHHDNWQVPANSNSTHRGGIIKVQ